MHNAKLVGKKAVQELSMQLGDLHRPKPHLELTAKSEDLVDEVVGEARKLAEAVRRKMDAADTWPLEVITTGRVTHVHVRLDSEDDDTIDRAMQILWDVIREY